MGKQLGWPISFSMELADLCLLFPAHEAIACIASFLWHRSSPRALFSFFAAWRSAGTWAYGR